jgi:hypothetical protein
MQRRKGVQDQRLTNADLRGLIIVPHRNGKTVAAQGWCCVESVMAIKGRDHYPVASKELGSLEKLPCFEHWSDQLEFPHAQVKALGYSRSRIATFSTTKAWETALKVYQKTNKLVNKKLILHSNQAI